MKSPLSAHAAPNANHRFPFRQRERNRWLRLRVGFRMTVDKASEYRDYAKRLRALVADDPHSKFKEELLQVADEYEALADQYAGGQSRKPKPKG